VAERVVTVTERGLTRPVEKPVVPRRVVGWRAQARQLQVQQVSGPAELPVPLPEAVKVPRFSVSHRRKAAAIRGRPRAPKMKMPMVM
jgi:hypothetical protein